MKLSLFDLHCDTALEIYLTKQSLASNSLAVSLDKSIKYEKYCQTLAIWSVSSLNNDEAFDQFKKTYSYLIDDLSNIPADASQSFVLAVEDARLLNNNIERLELLKTYKIKILTLMWSGLSCLGGAHDTSYSLTPFGETVVRKCFDFGIVVDISHASRESTQKVFELSNNKYPIIASHSNAYSVFSHTRNLTDEEFMQIVKCSGLVGINLYYKHLGLEQDATEEKALDKIIKHIDHFLSLGGENTVCLGCDFDGAKTPKCLNNISDLDKIANKMLSKGYSETTVNKIFFDNAQNFANKNFL